MEAILYELPGPPPGWLVELADDMLEDPRCRVVVLGTEDTQVVLFTVWDSEAGPEVEAALRVHEEGTVRRLRVGSGHAVWG